MKLTLQIQLLPDKRQSAQLRETIERFNAACNWLAEKASEQHTANKVLLQQRYYSEIRERFKLSAQMTVRCIAQVCEAYKRDKSRLPKFRKHAAMPLDQRLMSFRSIDRVSILTLQGRVIVPFVMGKYQRERFTTAVGQSDLVLRKDGKWFLLVTVDLPEDAPIPSTDFLGIDMGTRQLATDSDGEHFDGAEVEATRLHYQKKRRELQKKAEGKKSEGKRPKNIRRKLKALSGRERRFKKDTNHRISRAIVDKAIDTGRGIAVEELSGIRDRTRFRQDQRDGMSKWAFYELRCFVEYKARLAGVRVVAIDPAYTSQRCCVCGHRERGNRRSRGIFWCKACGHFDHADINAAKNISLKAAVNQLNVSEPEDYSKPSEVQGQAASFTER
ncbi:MAG: transposase [Acidobacteriota bacterium]